jgi:ABC-type branched-subunit amino acid transport system ATPase component
MKPHQKSIPTAWFRFSARLKMKKPQPKALHLWNIPDLDKRPVIVALAGSNGAGKTTFYEAHLNRNHAVGISSGERNLAARPPY